MNITQSDIIMAAYLFLIVGGLITLYGSLVVYFNNKKRSKSILRR